MGDNLPPQCLKITTDFIDDKLSLLFKDPFHPDKEIQDEYYSIIKKPMDLSTVMRKLKENAYISIGDWSDDMNLIFDNAIKYNGESSLVGSIALYLKQKFEKKKKSIENLNSRNYEDQIIAYTRELNQTLLKPPDSLSVEIDTQASINRLNNQQDHLILEVSHLKASKLILKDAIIDQLELAIFHSFIIMNK